MLARYKRHHVFEHRHIDRLATSRLFAPVESKTDRLSRDQTGNVIGHHHWHEARFAGRAVDRASHAGKALDDWVVGGPVETAPTTTEGEDRAVNKPRVSLSKAPEIEARPFQRLGPHIGDEHVGTGEEAAQCGHTIWVFEVEADRALVAIEVEEL